MAAFGLKLQAPAAPAVLGIWPENWATFKVYYRMQTQWRVGGMGSVVGLDYATLAFFLTLEGVERQDWPEVTSGVQIMEYEAMRLMRAGVEA